MRKVPGLDTARHPTWWLDVHCFYHGGIPRLTNQTQNGGWALKLPKVVRLQPGATDPLASSGVAIQVNVGRAGVAM